MLYLFKPACMIRGGWIQAMYDFGGKYIADNGILRYGYIVINV